MPRPHARRHIRFYGSPRPDDEKEKERGRKDARERVPKKIDPRQSRGLVIPRVIRARSCENNSAPSTLSSQ